MLLRLRDDDDDNIVYISPEKELNVGLWFLFGGATLLLALRVWVKVTRRHGLWWDDAILIASWFVLMANDSLITYEYAHGYVPLKGKKWDDKMHILINISSCGTLIGQAWSKTAFGVTLLKLTNRWGQWIIWFCITTMNAYMVAKCIFQWGKLCDEKSYDVWYRLDFCVDKQWLADFKEGGQVYNVIMDFVFALFPWILTWKLDIRKSEKIALCITMSLGMVIAIVTAIRISWKDEGNKRDPYYYWRNGMSNIWYSSEVAGTIMVQCIPVLRPFLKEVHTSLTSKRLPSIDDTDRRSNTLVASKSRISNRTSKPPTLKDFDEDTMRGFNFGFHEVKVTGGFELNRISEEKQGLREEDRESGVWPRGSWYRR
ncbi:hypothetical protein K491DRAFT_597197 [Lophiostoma macrostomum CBS 122681]|uniref:Rhodopsin domain-containing protein n=1 Tax=Lophiostoma macrostomum CBS 122681 TaxID=1314788 RepID=A0A6A6T8Y8_9PLEO|nr:hypothetical protein K491DRAFT_597197 [Lophiostoma macrostomum CBS 122681]